ncbi:PREDICTED: N-acetylaspartate synthetase [Miniopterus natalensis]|uniref:N-acetylaspartate synthetase n=1 Tax=Miniopterus natalensis TaxID=291302 RepID=UPI0007A715D0|nr:PREDICTED: N-acetylaspartate synthetase [Miniopterus natalensis]
MVTPHTSDLSYSGFSVVLVLESTVGRLAESRPCVDCHAFEFMQRALQDLRKTAYSLDTRTETLLLQAERRALSQPSWHLSYNSANAEQQRAHPATCVDLHPQYGLFTQILSMPQQDLPWPPPPPRASQPVTCPVVSDFVPGSPGGAGVSTTVKKPESCLRPVLCFTLTRSLLLTLLVPAGLLGLRYYYSRKVILAYLDCALHTDMADIEQYYMKPPGSCFWVAVLDGNVVGIVAARAHEADNALELLRMSVDSRFRGKGIAKALGRKVLEFALVHNYSAVVLGTTAVKVAAHKLYESLGFRHMGSSDHYVLPGMTLSLAERLFFQVRYHRYRLQLREE